LYYRLLRLLSVSVQPLFVFDGPHKPTFKRNKRSGHNAGSLSNVLTKQLLKLFGFPFHIAPGEAEAECALLQREGIVDAVLSEDVDTLMFGCGVTLRNWSSGVSKGNHSPTHVSLYDAQETKKGKSGLDREGMILVAMMSGGDYITEGIPGCGIKVACQAARAGFGKSLCRLSRSDAAGLVAWRKSLSHEIQTNENQYFRTRHKALKIPDNFPNKEVLGYYTHPVVSSASKINKLREDIVWDGEVDIPGLRLFVAETFEWVNKGGAKKFIRGLAPVLLIHKLRLRGDRRESGFGDVVLTAMNEMELVRAICGRRNHFSTDGTPELRVIFHPVDIVGLDLDAEEDGSEDYGRDGLAPVNDDDEIECYGSDTPASSLRSASPCKRPASAYDPTQPEKLWVLETIAKVGIPLKVEDYEESLRNPRKFIAAKAAAKRAANNRGMQKGAIEKFVKISKPSIGNGSPTGQKLSNEPLNLHNQPALSETYLAPVLEKPISSRPTSVPTSSMSNRSARTTRSSARESAEIAATKPKTTSTKITRQALTEKPDKNANPWTLAQSSPSTRGSPVTTKPLSQSSKPRSPKVLNHGDYIDLCSSTNASPSCTALSLPSSPRKHTHSAEREKSLEAQRPKSAIGKESFSPPLTPPKDETTLDGPSPKKKRSVESPSKATTPKLPQYPRGRTQPLTSEPVNHKIDFQPSITRAQSSSPAFPSLQDLVSPDVLPLDDQQVEDTGGANKLSPSGAWSEKRIERDGNIPHGRGAIEITTIQSSPPNTQSPVILSPRLSVSKDQDLKSQRKAVKGKKYLMLRDSLPGTWKEVDESMIGNSRRRAWRQSQVEVLDMTAD
jgi:holliday junction resolvase YEN1